MKKCILILFLFLYLFTACSKPPAELAEDTMLETEAVAVTSPALTEEELLNLFHGYAYADPANRVVTDCVVMPESDHGVIGVVQYTTEDYNGCQFDFLRAEGPPLQAGVEALPIEYTLEYAAKDTVTFDLMGDDGEVYRCTLSFYQNDIECGFKIETEQKEG